MVEIRHRPVDLHRLQQALEGLREVAGLMMDDADQVQRPDLDQGSRATSGQVSSLEGETERLVELTELIRHAGQAIQGLRLAVLIGVRASQHPCLLHQ